jgi:ATP-dependent DNA ligase
MKPSSATIFEAVAYYSGDGGIIYKHACALGCEGIVSKRSVRRTGPVAPSVG